MTSAVNTLKNGSDYTIINSLFICNVVASMGNCSNARHGEYITPQIQCEILSGINNVLYYSVARQ